MRVEINAPECGPEPQMWVQHGQVLAMVLRAGSIDVGVRRSEMTRFTYQLGEMFLCHRHVKKWIRTQDLHYLSLDISDAALTAAYGETSGEVELPSEAHNHGDRRCGAA
jgi:hypothetical protein